MNLQYCPRCSRRTQGEGSCPYCGFTLSLYRVDDRVLPVGSMVGSWRVGALLAVNRQAQFYAAVNVENDTRAVVEEFMPSVVMGRSAGDTRVKIVKHENSVREAQKLFWNSKQNRKYALLEMLENNGTVYRVYDAGDNDQDTIARNLADDPVLFRDAAGIPQMTINGIPIPKLPAERAFRGQGAVKTGNHRVGRILLPIFLIIALLVIGYFIAKQNGIDLLSGTNGARQESTEEPIIEADATVSGAATEEATAAPENRIDEGQKEAAADQKIEEPEEKVTEKPAEAAVEEAAEDVTLEPSAEPVAEGTEKIVVQNAEEDIEDTTEEVTAEPSVEPAAEGTEEIAVQKAEEDEDTTEEVTAEPTVEPAAEETEESLTESESDVTEEPAAESTETAPIEPAENVEEETNGLSAQPEDKPIELEPEAVQAETEPTLETGSTTDAFNLSDKADKVWNRFKGVLRGTVENAAKEYDHVITEISIATKQEPVYDEQDWTSRLILTGKTAMGLAETVKLSLSDDFSRQWINVGVYRLYPEDIKAPDDYTWLDNALLGEFHIQPRIYDKPVWREPFTGEIMFYEMAETLKDRITINDSKGEMDIISDGLTWDRVQLIIPKEIGSGAIDSYSLKLNLKAWRNEKFGDKAYAELPLRVVFCPPEEDIEGWKEMRDLVLAAISNKIPGTDNLEQLEQDDPKLCRYLYKNWLHTEKSSDEMNVEAEFTNLARNVAGRENSNITFKLFMQYLDEIADEPGNEDADSRDKMIQLLMETASESDEEDERGESISFVLDELEDGSGGAVDVESEFPVSDETGDRSGRNLIKVIQLVLQVAAEEEDQTAEIEKGIQSSESTVSDDVMTENIPEETSTGEGTEKETDQTDETLEAEGAQIDGEPETEGDSADEESEAKGDSTDDEPEMKDQDAGSTGNKITQTVRVNENGGQGNGR